MKSFLLVGVLLTIAAVGRAQPPPDPRDSIILESKTVAPGAHPGGASDTAAYVYLLVWITNKDSLTAVVLGLEELSLTGGAYLIAARPRNFAGTISRLTNTLRGNTIASFTPYHSNSPDSFSVVGLYDPLDVSTIEPANPARKPLWEIKFDSVWSNPGTVEFDTVRIAGQPTGFANTVPMDLRVHFVKSVVTVGVKGDFNMDGILNLNDVVEIINGIFLQELPGSTVYPFDLNCDGRRSAADVIWELNAVFLSEPFPC